MLRFRSDGNDRVSSAYYRIFMSPKAFFWFPSGLPASPDGFNNHVTSGDRPCGRTLIPTFSHQSLLCLLILSSLFIFPLFYLPSVLPSPAAHLLFPLFPLSPPPPHLSHLPEDIGERNQGGVMKGQTGTNER